MSEAIKEMQREFEKGTRESFALRAVDELVARYARDPNIAYYLQATQQMYWVWLSEAKRRGLPAKAVWGWKLGIQSQGGAARMSECDFHCQTRRIEELEKKVKNLGGDAMPEGVLLADDEGPWEMMAAVRRLVRMARLTGEPIDLDVMEDVLEGCNPIWP